MIKIVSTQIEGLCGPIVYSADDCVDGIIEELKMCIEQLTDYGESDFVLTIRGGEMSEEDFENMEEFTGY